MKYAAARSNRRLPGGETAQHDKNASGLRSTLRAEIVRCRTNARKLSDRVRSRVKQTEERTVSVYTVFLKILRSRRLRE